MRTVKSEISACKQVIELWALVRDYHVLGAYYGYDAKAHACGALGMEHYDAHCPCCEFVGEEDGCNRCPMMGFWRADEPGGWCMDGIFGEWYFTRSEDVRAATAGELVEAAREALAYWQAMREMNQQ